MRSRKARRTVWHGQAIATTLTERLGALDLPVPVSVTVDLDTPWNEATEQPRTDWAFGPIDTAIAAAIEATPTPDALPGTTLERAES